jgi:hypothetical protein
MRLIDADELKKDDEVTQWLSLDAVRTGKTLKMFSELFVKKIDEQPTIQAISIDVLEKIMDEVCDIDDKIVLNPDSVFDRKAYVRLIDVANIIDKYKAEKEEKR